MGSCKNVKINFASILIFTFTNFLFSDLNNSLLHFILSWSTSVENSLAGKNYDFAIVLMLLTVTSKVTPFSFKRLTKDVSLNAYPGVKTPVNNNKKSQNKFGLKTASSTDKRRILEDQSHFPFSPFQWFHD